MESVKHKELIIGCIRHHFDGALQMVKNVGGGSGKAPPAIANIKSSLVNAAGGVDACIYDDHDLSSKLLEPGVDLAYRSVIVSDLKRDDEWVAVLAVGLTELDEHSRKVVLSHVPKRDGGEASPRRLLVFIACADGTVTMNPRFVIASAVDNNSIALSPCVFQWAIPQPNGQSAVVGRIAPSELGQAFLDWAALMLSVLDSSHAARLHEDHVRGETPGAIQ
ncbi:hypothetical protein [Paraburkholderia acidisoli]|uniref:Uncharacterized protein n=1 Tax=Paraburkholderia acidisoli TaxID=2571748 RepID=A0A7Z2GEY7_9BURK|nr:hypothetical protein [Paraburkholderia acidisoli]QGZ60526.1 hypothetical protein FAZ98_01575 [Paraburkholderia acidisoli]